MQGTAAPERKARIPELKKSLPKAGQAIVIGKDGKMKVQTAKPAPAKPSAPKPVAKTAPHNHKPAVRGTGKPVQRVNRGRGQNGKRG